MIISNINNQNYYSINNKKYILRDYDETVDGSIITSIPRLQFSYGYDGLEAMSTMIDFSIRPSLSKRARKKVIVDANSQQHAIGGYGCNIKDMLVNNIKTTVVYSFDIHLSPEHRNQSLSSVLLSDIVQVMREESPNPLYLVSSSKSNTAINRSIAKQVNSFQCYDQRQSAWSCEADHPLTQPNKSTSIVVKTMNDSSVIKRKWERAFKHYNFIPANFDDILVDNAKYHQTTYFATLTRQGIKSKLASASISVWNQDLIFTLRNKQQQTLRHRQLFSCYAMGEESDDLYRYLLGYVHNDLRRQGVNYLFIGYSINDPLSKYYPLKQGIKDLDFVASVGALSINEKEQLQKKTDTSASMWNDPRDYGILMLYNNHHHPVQHAMSLTLSAEIVTSLVGTSANGGGMGVVGGIHHQHHHHVMVSSPRMTGNRPISPLQMSALNGGLMTPVATLSSPRAVSSPRPSSPRTPSPRYSALKT